MDHENGEGNKITSMLRYVLTERYSIHQGQDHSFMKELILDTGCTGPRSVYIS